jgi:ferric-dicitrate binding protein FerR (iron transport regulator)
MFDIDILIQKFIQGKSSDAENLQLYQWVHESPENEKRLFTEKDIWDSYGFQSDKKNYQISPELELLKKRINTNKIPRQLVSMRRIVQIAAMLFIAFGLGWGSRYITFNDNNLQTAEVTMQDVYVPKGQVNQVFLADGTRIWINSGTHLTIPSVFGNNQRAVKLKGEAFFEVAKDKKRPFRVEVNGQLIEVLGTSFNVRAYDNSNVIETTLATGQIKLSIGEQITLLNPGEQSLFDKTENQLTVKKVIPSTFSSWKDGRYEFRNEDLTEVFKVIERWYDVDISADEAHFSGMHFSGVIKRNKDVRHFLELVNFSVPISYKINADKIQIQPK